MFGNGLSPGFRVVSKSNPKLITKIERRPDSLGVSCWWYWIPIYTFLEHVDVNPVLLM